MKHFHRDYKETYEISVLAWATREGAPIYCLAGFGIMLLPMLLDLSRFSPAEIRYLSVIDEAIRCSLFEDSWFWFGNSCGT